MKWVIVTAMIISNGQLQLSEEFSWPTLRSCVEAADERRAFLLQEGFDLERFRVTCYRVDENP